MYYCIESTEIVNRQFLFQNCVYVLCKIVEIRKTKLHLLISDKQNDYYTLYTSTTKQSIYLPIQHKHYPLMYR